MKAEHEFHMGNLIKAVFDKSGLSVSELARRIHCERTNVYNILKNPDINTAVLMRISKALKCNLFAHYSREFQKKRGKT